MLTIPIFVTISSPILSNSHFPPYFPVFASLPFIITQCLI